MLESGCWSVVQAVNRAIALEGPSHPDVHSMIVRVCSAAQPSSKPAKAAEPAAAQTSEPQQVRTGSFDGVLFWQGQYWVC